MALGFRDGKDPPETKAWIAFIQREVCTMRASWQIDKVRDMSLRVASAPLECLADDCVSVFKSNVIQSSRRN